MTTRVHLDGVSVRYRLAKQRVFTFKEYAIRFLQGRLRHEEFWALRDVTLEIAAGERLGIVGHNGAGKSTLLKIVSGVMAPTEGRVEVRGSVAPILQLGAGFDTEISGMENIFLNAMLLGRRRVEIEEKVEEIVEFSGLEEFIYSPLRNYSTGMIARLGFSIATAWVPDVLILDEVLAVGDAAFVEKCAAKIESYQQSGTTMIMVSHALDVVVQMCTRCLWLDHGRIAGQGNPAEVVAAYRAQVQESSSRAAPPAAAEPVDPASLPQPSAPQGAG